MIVNVMSIIHFDFVHFIVIRHAIQVWEFVTDKYVFAPSHVHFYFYFFGGSLLTTYNSCCLSSSFFLLLNPKIMFY